MLYVFSIEPSTDGPERGLRCVLIKKQFKISPAFHAAGYKQTIQLGFAIVEERPKYPARRGKSDVRG